MADSILNQLLASYPALRSLSAHTLASTVRQLPQMRVPARTVLFDEGEPCKGFPFLLEGEIGVARGSPDGRELSLYRVCPGEVCVVSSGCLFGSRPMYARGTTLTDSFVVIASADCIRDWTDSRPVRDFLFGTLADRLTELMELVEAVAFQRLDQRLARTLLGHGQTLHLTHQQIADELGTAREMVSRLLKRFEIDGLVHLGRERIDIVDAAKVRHLAGSL
ncbi:MAG: Crp/Fnr family transcriptional regulator [Burkholderiaceae bacterium]|nr:Crp/Fnr family transcriptional regulator [Burkholderiaceae bacterium]